jgi:hypothetical protein
MTDGQKGELQVIMNSLAEKGVSVNECLTACASIQPSSNSFWKDPSPDEELCDISMSDAKRDQHFENRYNVLRINPSAYNEFQKEEVQEFIIKRGMSLILLI